MSIIWTLKKLVDPIAHRQEAAALKKEREQPRYSMAGDPPDPGAAGEEHPHVCTFCGHESREPEYCPVCLADTMRPVVSPPEKDEK